MPMTRAIGNVITIPRFLSHSFQDHQSDIVTLERLSREQEFLHSQWVLNQDTSIRSVTAFSIQLMSRPYRASV
jgi:hypothetical protein